MFISERVEGTAPALADVRDAVLRDWDSQKRKHTNALFYETLLKRYKVTVANQEIPTTTKAAMESDAQ